MALPISLRTETETIGITDALLRAVLGLDTNDRAMFDSAWVSDGEVTFEMDGRAQNGMEEIGKTFAFIGPLDTQHMISNVRVNHPGGEESAKMMAYAWAQHHRAGEGRDPSSKHLTSGSRYWIDVEQDKEDGLWKIRKWSMNIVWIDGDGSIVGM